MTYFRYCNDFYMVLHRKPMKAFIRKSSRSQAGTSHLLVDEIGCQCTVIATLSLRHLVQTIISVKDPKLN